MSSAFRTKAGAALASAEAAAMASQFSAILTEIAMLLETKGSDYNELTTFAENMIHGDLSWSTMCVVKAHRAASLVHKAEVKQQSPVYDTLDDVIFDLCVYAASWLAFRRMSKMQEG